MSGACPSTSGSDRLELPIGLAAVTLALVSVAVINLFTKQVATIAGAGFTAVLYTAILFSERATARRQPHGQRLDQFHLLPAPDVGLAEVALDPYAAESPAELFAVLTEYFFELPQALHQAYPSVYEQMQRYYRQHPLAR